MADHFKWLHQDPFILECCLPNKSQSYIGVDSLCQKHAILCLNHSCHTNTQGLIHQIMPLKEFKRKLDFKKFQMQQKTNEMIESLNKLIDTLIEQLKQIKLRKCLQLSMLWLRDLANNQQEYELMKKIFRADYSGLSCQDIHSVYYKILHNQQLYGKDINEIECYRGISKALEELKDNKKATNVLAQKFTQFQGVLTNGEILKKVLPDRAIRSDSLKEVMLESPSQNFQISYNKAEITVSSSEHKSFFSKYPLISHTTYHLTCHTKYSNIILGICTSNIKKSQSTNDLHYDEESITFNCANGNIYKEGMFTNSSNKSIKNLTLLNVKLRLTDKEMFLMTNKNVLARVSLAHLKGELFLLVCGRSKGDKFEVYCDNDISADNVRVLRMIEQEENTIVPIENELIKSQLKDFHDSIIEEEASVSLSNVGNKLNEQRDQDLDNSFKTKDFRKSDIRASEIRKSQKQYPHRNEEVRNSQISDIRKSEIRNSQIPLYSIQVKDEGGGILETLKNSNLSKRIIPDFNNSTVQIRDDNESNKNSSNRNSSKQNSSSRRNEQDEWNKEKSKHLESIKQKFDILKKKTFEKDIVANELSLKSIEKQNASKIDSVHFKNQKSSSGGDIFGSGGSKVKINISDQVSDIHSKHHPVLEVSNTLSILNKLRRGSDNIEFVGMKQRQKQRGVLEMSQSMQAEANVDEEIQKVKEMKTPPKIIINNYQHEHGNDSFEF